MKKLFLISTILIATVIGISAQNANGYQEDLQIKNGDRTIFGIISRPSNGMKKQPIAIIAHGFNGGHKFGKNYFDMLNSIGYQCYTFDFPYGSTYSKSNPNTMNMSVRDEQGDLQAIVQYFKKQPDIDTSHIVLIGESQGGLVAALAAAEKAKDIDKLILIYPAFCIPDNWNHRYPQLEEIPDTTRIWNVPLGKKYFTELHDMKPYEEIARYKKPVLIIHGDADNVVPIEYSNKALKTYKQAELHTIPKAGHGFKPDELKQALGWIEEFLK